MIFLDWRQSGAPGWIEAYTGYRSLDFINRVEWIRSCKAPRALDLYSIREVAEGGRYILWSVYNVEYIT